MGGWKKTLFIVVVGLMIGVPVGVSTATFVTANGLSYLSNDARTCINCHIMRDNFDAWTASSHHNVASCNGCHTHGSIVEKYAQKALNGYLHSWAFSTGRFEEPIRIKDFNRKIVIKNCLKCHAQLIESGQYGHLSFANNNCLSCHQNVGHRKW